MTLFRTSLMTGLVLIGLTAPAPAAPQGTMTWGVYRGSGAKLLKERVREVELR